MADMGWSYHLITGGSTVLRLLCDERSLIDQKPVAWVPLIDRQRRTALRSITMPPSSTNATRLESAVINNDFRLPLSAAQTEIWLAQRLDPENPIYNTGDYVDIHGPVDSVVFEAAVRQVITETESAHARFGSDGDDLWQTIEVSSDWRLPFIDVSGQPVPHRAAESWMWADLGTPVDLSRGPLFAQALFKVALHAPCGRGLHRAQRRRERRRRRFRSVLPALGRGFFLSGVGGFSR